MRWNNCVTQRSQTQMSTSGTRLAVVVSVPGVTQQSALRDYITRSPPPFCWRWTLTVLEASPRCSGETSSSHISLLGWRVLRADWQGGVGGAWKKQEVTHTVRLYVSWWWTLCLPELSVLSQRLMVRLSTMSRSKSEFWTMNTWFSSGSEAMDLSSVSLAVLKPERQM